MSSSLEDFSYALESTIKTKISAALTEMQTAAGDGIELQNFAMVEVGYNNVFGQRKYPVCFLYPSEPEYEPSAFGAELVRLNIEVWFAVTDSVPEKLTKKVLRYFDSIRNVVINNNTLGGVVINASVTGGRFWPGGPDNSKIAAGSVVVSIVGEIRN